MATYSQRSLNQIIAEFQEIANQHRFINSFACGTQDDFATSGDTQYPAMWVRHEGVTVDRKVQTISFAVLMIDRVKKDRSNMQEVLSDTIRTLSDFRIQIEQPAYGWEISFSESTPVYEEYMEDEVAGWETTFTITQPFINDVCAIPFIVAPTPTNGWTAGGGNTDWPNYVPTSRILTINGTAYDLSADRSWTISASGGTWGSITGTLSNQTDLQNALDSKQPIDADLTSWAGVTRASGFDTFVATPSSANLAALVTDELSNGSAPKLILSDGGLNVSSGKTLASTQSLTLTGTDSTSFAFPAWNDTVMTGKSLIITTGNQTTTSDVAANITGLVSETLTINARYFFTGVIYAGCNNTGGVKFAITVPTGATFTLTASGQSTSGNAWTRTVVTGSGTLSGALITQNNSGHIFFNIEVTMSSTAGVVQFQFASGTNTQTSTIFQQSTLINYFRIA